MTSIDVLFESDYADAHVREAVAEVVGVSGEKVLVIHDVSEYPQLVSEQVVCLINNFPEGFRQLLTIDCRKNLNVENVVCRLSSILSVRCLLPADQPNPFAMRLILPDGEVSDVYVDVSALDDRGVYILK